MFIAIGNAHAIEGIQNPDGPPGELIYGSIPGEQVTSFKFPEGMDIEVAVMATVDALDSHMASGHFPAWIDGAPKTLVRQLCKHYKITARENVRPAEWGKKL